MTGGAAKPLVSFLMVILITLWGSSFVVVKMALGEGLTPIALATYRFLIAGGLFLVISILKERKSTRHLLVERKSIPKLIVLALTGITFFFAAQYTGIQMVGATVASIFVCFLSPILITVFSAKLLRERLVRGQILGVGIAAAGTLTVILGGASYLQTGTGFILGSLILLLTPILWTAYSLLGKKMIEQHDAFLVATYVTVLGGLFLVPFSWAEGSLHQIWAVSLNGWLDVLFLSVTCSLIGYYIWFYALKQLGAAVTSSFLFAEPFITMLLAGILTGEILSIFIVAGGFLILAGVYLVTAKWDKPNCPSEFQ